MWEFKSGGDDANAELGRYLSEREGKELIVIPPDELNRLANIVGLVALEGVGVGDVEIDFNWRSNIMDIRRQFPRKVIYPASFSSRPDKGLKKKEKKKKRKLGDVEKLKHGAFDVYRMK